MKYSILFVDDDPLVRDVFQNFAVRLGYAVELASDGLEAIQKARSAHYPVIVTDLCMPGLDGLALLECIRGLSPDSITMLVTGAPEVELPRADAMDCSLAAILRKPLGLADLRNALERACSLYEARRPSGPGHDHILLIEDDPVDERLTLARLSKDLPTVSVHVVRRLDEAEAYLSKRSVQVILTDLNLPDGRGIDAVERLRVAQPEAAIVVLSGAQSEQIAVASLKQGAQDYLLKDSADGPTLKRSIRYALERKQCEARLLDMAYRDSVTSLPNRKLFQDRLVQALARARRGDTELALVFIDLDRFKAVNDTLGHEAGDRLLKIIGDRLTATLRGTDTVARLGGDEFAALLEGAGQGEVTRLAEKIIQTVCEPVQLEGQWVSVGASLGAAAYPAHGFTAEGLLRSADAAMYRSKRNGRGQLHWAQEAADEEARQRLRFETDLRQALLDGDFELYYQPQLELRSGVTVAFEALLRWRRRGQLLNPAQFLPLLEELKLGPTLAEWELRTACALLAEHRQDDWRVALNLSAQQLHPGLPEVLARCLRQYEISATRLEFELTESTLCKDEPASLAVLAQLREMGVRITLDNFGTGHSSLLCLRRLPVHGVKFDGAFLASGGSLDFARSVTGLGHSLGLTVSAEKVEHPSQLDLLVRSGCEVVQGCLVSSPLATAKVGTWLACEQINWGRAAGFEHALTVDLGVFSKLTAPRQLQP